MPVFSIPAVYLPGFQGLVDLSDSERSRVLEAFTEATAAIDLTRIARRVAEASELSNDTINAITGSIFSLAALRSRHGMSAAETAEAIQLSELEITEEKVPDMREFLGKIIDLPAIRMTVRAVDLAASDERLYVSSRIVTDLRPVFPEPWDTENAESMAPIATLVVHSLRMEYLEGQNARTFQVALDAADIETLKADLARAERKAVALAEFSGRAGLPDIPVAPEAPPK